MHRTNRAAMQELAVDALSKAAFLQDHSHRPIRIRQGCHQNISYALAMARRGQIDVALANRSAAIARLRYQLNKWTSKWHEFTDPLLEKQARACVEELLRRRVDEEQSLIDSDNDEWHWQGTGNRCGREGLGLARYGLQETILLPNE
jgi:hypothetical protein